jgi:hypothetical protein
MKEKRTVARQRVFKAGSIEFDGNGVDCVIRNLSPMGAGLEVANPVGNHAMLSNRACPSALLHRPAQRKTGSASCSIRRRQLLCIEPGNARQVPLPKGRIVLVRRRGRAFEPLAAGGDYPNVSVPGTWFVTYPRDL